MNIPRPLSRNTLKIIAAVSMLLDHIGFFIYPQIAIFRMLGRLAFPVFAFFIAEGTRYTKNRLKYLLRMVAIGIVCQIPASIATPNVSLNIFITFSISILIIYLFDWLKSAKEKNERIFLAILNILFLVLVFIVTRLVNIEYGFAGILFAPLVSIPRTKGNTQRDLFLKVGMSIPAFIALSVEYFEIFQPLSLLAIPLLLLYSGERGKYKLKYFFYIFYPAHLLLLYYIADLIK